MGNAAALLAGPRLIARRPGVFAAWAGVGLVQQFVYLAVDLWARGWSLGAATGPLWAALAYLPFEAVLVAAAFRAFVRPQAGRAAYLRLGPVEARMAGLLALAALVALAVSLTVALAVGYIAFLLRRKLLAGVVLSAGSLVAVLALLRFFPAAAILLDSGRVDLAAAWRATRGRYLRLALLVLLIAVGARLLFSAVELAPRPPFPVRFADLVSPVRLAILAWRALVEVLGLTMLAGTVAAVWRSGRQTPH